MQTMTLDEVMENFHPGGGKDFAGKQTWLEVFDYMNQSAAEMDRIFELRQRIRDGADIYPICLNFEEKYLSNGCHRIYAYYLENHENIPVCDEDNKPEWKNSDVIVVNFTSAQTVDEWFEGEGIDAIKSFPIGDEWTETDVFSFSDGMYDTWFYWDRNRIDELLFALVNRANKYGFSINVSSAYYLSQEDIDNDNF